MTQRENCAGCGGRVQPFLDLGKTPVANTYPTSVDAVERFYPLGLGVCPTCWLVQQVEVVPDHELYEMDYGFYSGASLPKVAYHRELADRLLREYPEQCRTGIVEIASNDGDLLRHFQVLGLPVLGVDPAAGPAGTAQRCGIETRVEPFTAALAQEIFDERGPIGLVIANHVLAHVSDPHDFLRGIATLMRADSESVAIIEVQYLADLLIGNQLDHVYHEHRFHFSLSALLGLASHYGLHVNDVRHTPAQSGSISVTFSHRTGMSEAARRMVTSEWWLEEEATYRSVQSRAEHVRFQLLGLIGQERAAGRRLAGYAAPAKATTLLNFCGLGPDVIEYVIDTTPQKWGRYVPGTRIPIVGRGAPERGVQGHYDLFIPDGRELPDTYLLLAWNYLADVLRRERRFMTDHNGRFIVPIPVPVML